MAIKEGIRTGGRSARVQESVHAAVRALLQEQQRDTLTVPLIASRAGVTPSTIYRRWGELTALLADVSLAHLRPDSEPADTGSLRGDLMAWAEQYLDEIDSAPGRAMMHDFLASGRSMQCATVLRSQLQTILDRALGRGEAIPQTDHLLNLIVAPVVYGVLFAESAPSLEQIQGLVALSLGG